MGLLPAKKISRLHGEARRLDASTRDRHAAGHRYRDRRRRRALFRAPASVAGRHVRLHLCAPARGLCRPARRGFGMSESTIVQAVNLALRRALEEDPSVVVIGQDIGRHGGIFRATEGLHQRFGSKRVIDTPLAETMIGGLAIGMAAQGLKPVCEIQFQGFLYPVLDNLANHATRMRTRTRGRITCPMVLRVTHGGGVHAPEHHSDAIESMLAHIPGLSVVIPSSPAKAYGLLLSAIRDPDPVVFLEPTRIYRSIKENVEDSGEGLPLGRCHIVRA